MSPGLYACCTLVRFNRSQALADLVTSGAIATAKSMGPKFQSEGEEVEEVRVIFPPGKI